MQECYLCQARPPDMPLLPQSPNALLTGGLLFIETAPASGHQPTLFHDHTMLLC